MAYHRAPLSRAAPFPGGPFPGRPLSRAAPFPRAAERATARTSPTTPPGGSALPRALPPPRRREAARYRAHFPHHAAENSRGASALPRALPPQRYREQPLAARLTVPAGGHPSQSLGAPNHQRRNHSTACALARSQPPALPRGQRRPSPGRRTRAFGRRRLRTLSQKGNDIAWRYATFGQKGHFAAQKRPTGTIWASKRRFLPLRGAYGGRMIA